MGSKSKTKKSRKKKKQEELEYNSLIPFLMEEAERMEKEYPNEYYDQGPALAVQELAVRYFS